MRAAAWITGAHGFIGRHLARECRARGWSVAGVGHGAWDEGEAERWGLSHWVRGEVRLETLELLAATAPAPDFIFHLAGGSSVGLSVAAPDEDHGAASAGWPTGAVAGVSGDVAGGCAAAFGAGAPWSWASFVSSAVSRAP